MAKKLKDYIKYLSNINTESLSEEERVKVTADLLIKIGFFAHERLIHLLVTITFAVLTILSLILVFISGSMATYALVILFLVLLIPYIRHYYILENGVQKLYEEYDRLR